jgi:hypothetical protein
VKQTKILASRRARFAHTLRAMRIVLGVLASAAAFAGALYLYAGRLGRAHSLS